MSNTPAEQDGTLVQQARRQSMQSRATLPDTADHSLSFIKWLTKGVYLLPPWWSEARDIELRKFWKQSDHLSGAVFAMTSKMTAIPFTVVSMDPSRPEWLEQADRKRNTLLYSAEFGKGWIAFYSKFVEDLLTQDKGAFAEVIGPGAPDGPLIGAPTSIAHLDSGSMQLTRNPEFPALYRDPKGGTISKIHYTRLIHISQMTSPIEEMNGVGFCSVSRAVNVTQTLIDIIVHKQEKLGSRPHRSMMVTKGGLDPADIGRAFQLADIEMDTQGLSRYSKTVVVGERNMPDADVEIKHLSSMPEGFDEETSVMLGMATIALAFGVDARELFPAMSSGATRADALLQHIKQRGKGPGQIMQAVEAEINHKFLPLHLKINFEFQDDSEDRQSAEIGGVRAERRNSDINAGVSTVRVERQKMLENGEITVTQLAEMELADGRTMDGRDILTLFYVDKAPFETLLDLGVLDPDNVRKHDPEVMLGKIGDAKSDARMAMAATGAPSRVAALKQAEGALLTLEAAYEEALVIAQAEAAAVAQVEAQGDGTKSPDTRIRTKDPVGVNQAEETGSSESLRPGKDDKVELKEARRAAVDEAQHRLKARLDSFVGGDSIDPTELADLYESLNVAEVTYDGSQ